MVLASWHSPASTDMDNRCLPISIYELAFINKKGPDAGGRASGPNGGRGKTLAHPKASIMMLASPAACGCDKCHINGFREDSVRLDFHHSRAPFLWTV